VREIDHLERAAAQHWQAPETQRLGEWLLRAAQGFTGRANSALPLGDPGMPLPEAVAAVTDWYLLDPEPSPDWLARYRYRGQDLPPIAPTLLMSAPWQVFGQHPGARALCPLRFPRGAPLPLSGRTATRGLGVWVRARFSLRLSVWRPVSATDLPARAAG
jgi:hypothetical protein